MKHLSRLFGGLWRAAFMSTRPLPPRRGRPFDVPLSAERVLATRDAGKGQNWHPRVRGRR